MFDLIVIGSGGASKISRPAADLGYKVAVIERDKLGGTCLNHGCIPSKMLIHPADVIQEIQTANKFFISTNMTGIDKKALMDRVNRDIQEDSSGIQDRIQTHPNMTLFKGSATFVGDKQVQVDGQVLTAKRIVIATGCRAHIPSIPGLKGTPFWTYKDALKKVPGDDMIVIGGGYIATELGYFHGKTGTKVTFLLRSTLLSGLDQDVQSRFFDSFSKQFPVHCDTLFESVSFTDNTFTVTTNHGVFTASTLLIATGVEPTTDELNLNLTGVETRKGGWIQVNDYMETTRSGIYSFGDVIGRHLFRHTANYEGEYLFKHLFHDYKQPISYPPIPYAVFSHPQIASVQSREADQVIIGTCEYDETGMGNAFAADGFVKLVFCRSTLELIQGHILGPEASSLVHCLIAFMKKKATLHDLLDTIYIHPTLGETIKNAARKLNHLQLEN